jgi:hypothetical protein
MADLNLRKLSAPLEALRPEVNAAYKKLETNWKEIADQLAKLPIPSKATFTIWHDGPDSVALEWRKWKGSKRVCITSYGYEHADGDMHETEDVTPFEEWSAEQRLDMLEHVPGLFEAAFVQTKQFIERINANMGGRE